MDEIIVNKMFETFDKLDENELTLIINQVARRMMTLRCATPDTAFWYSVLLRVSKWLATTPFVDETEKKFLINPPFDGETRLSGRVQAMKHMRERSGAQLSACKEIIDVWIKDNLSSVHPTVSASWLSNNKNVEIKEKSQ
jgi:hypothetical protein